jgi:hypothetical protein
MYILLYNHSDLQDSADVAEFLASFLRRIVKEGVQEFILECSFINGNSDGFCVLRLCFFDIFGLVIQKLPKDAKNHQNGGFLQFLSFFWSQIQKYQKNKVVGHRNCHYFCL